MEPTEIQEGLSRLSGDARLRERFFDDPARVGRELGLSAADVRRLAQLSGPQVKAFGTAPHGRRFLEICKVLPMSHRMLRERFTQYFHEYTAAHPQPDRQRHLGDDLAFALYAERRLRREGAGPRWLLDLLRYERARLQAADPARRFVACPFRHDISRLVRSIARREEQPTVVPRWSLGIWWRPRRRGAVRFEVLTPPMLPRRQTPRG